MALGPSVAVVGPTASGKSAVALAAARRCADFDIVSVDSMQSYRGLDIGTAKPTAHEQREVPHHLLDMVEPHEEWSVAQFQEQLRRVLHGIAGRGRRALFVGGTGLYLRAVVDGLDLPGQWPDLRAELEQRGASEGSRALHDELRQCDPVAAHKIEPDNLRRIVRALEVTKGSGRAFSSFGGGLDSYPPTCVHQVGLRWRSDVLEARIVQRITVMLESGWLDEVAAVTRGRLPLSRTAAVAVGYRELGDHLEGRCTLEEARAAIVIRTRQLAARQMRWFRRDPRIRWVDVVDDPVAEALPLLLELVHP
jgi:tRNA dimethylallyltransferase